ncbi:uncharacterized protein cubi_03582 [Cryptosporidium ubiquitum]|uniref:THAP-type domain-containing protein n=1 Tax=Cryptosporidium ubiquitum TaxID=857276 RepID=A0A1J4MHU6_9CRYT|nr:uncharacterized protein cubi_03582 [Cryptosporidium ubiquitum]OII73784.1 hypothetical protein cubi_03582 [Cryptosporidium ubiquitum]
MKNLLLTFLLIIVSVNYLAYVESASINRSPEKLEVSVEVQANSSTTTIKPISTNSSQAADKGDHYLSKNKTLEGRTSTWNRFITLIIENVNIGNNWQDLLSKKASEYSEYNNPQYVLCSDHFEHEKLSEKYFRLESNVPVHFPTEVKDIRIVSSIRKTPNLNMTETLKLSNFPRPKHFRKSLVLLTPEPYQRLMTYAIEQCMIPSTWYLELIHCMYVGMAPKFSGMIFSYSLQDVVGSALMSISYKDERFNLENCFNAISLVVDDYISPYYMDICNNVLACLESKQFEKQFSKQKKEFEKRVEDAYKHIPVKQKFLTPMQFYRYAFLLSMSLVKDKSIDLKIYSERNFLPVRIALASLAYYAISDTLGWAFESEKKVSVFFTKIIMKMIFEISLISIPGCIKRLSKFSNDITVERSIIFELFCKEIFSAGFIVEATNELPIDKKLHSKAIMPQRILDSSYHLFVPDMTSDLHYSGYDHSWVYAQIEFNSPSLVRQNKVQKAYKSKKLKRTVKTDHFKDGFGPQSGEFSIKKVNTGRRTRIGYLINFNLKNIFIDGTNTSIMRYETTQFFSICLIVIFITINLIQGSKLTGYKLEPGIEADNGWQKMILEVNSAYKNSSGNSLIEPTTTFINDYTNFKESFISFNRDVCIEIPDVISSSKPEFNYPIHIPLERKSVSSFIRRRISINLSSPNYNSNIQYPRVKHFKYLLPELVIEPYQRLMSFAIEVCMIPSIWYIEIIHCMHMGMAPFFTGALMSYNLQDIIGASIMSMGYKDEKFSIDNCKNSVSIVADDQISPYYEEICKKVESCIISRPFNNGPFSRLKTELQERINRSYRLIKPIDGFLDPKSFARFAILTTISIIPNNKFLSRVSSEKNFLVIRSMLSSIGYYALSSIAGLKFISEFSVAKFFSKMIPEWLSMTIPKFQKNCISQLAFFSKANAQSYELFKYFCQEVFSSGFIYENNKLYIKLEKMDSVYPQRVLHAHYPYFIPSMAKRKLYTEYDNSWAAASTTESFKIPSIMEKPNEGFSKIYFTKQYRKTRRKAINGQGIGPLENKYKKRTTKYKIKSRLTKVLCSKKTKNHIDIMNHVKK